jgi:hypothetical protein
MKCRWICQSTLSKSGTPSDELRLRCGPPFDHTAMSAQGHQSAAHVYGASLLSGRVLIRAKLLRVWLVHSCAGSGGGRHTHGAVRTAVAVLQTEVLLLPRSN